MSPTLLRALVVSVPIAAIFAWSAVSCARAKTRWSLLQLLGAAALVVVGLAHICEGLRWFPAMGWGSPASPGHYLDLASAVLGLALLPVGYAGARRGRALGRG